MDDIHKDEGGPPNVAGGDREEVGIPDKDDMECPMREEGPVDIIASPDAPAEAGEDAGGEGEKPPEAPTPKPKQASKKKTGPTEEELKEERNTRIEMFKANLTLLLWVTYTFSITQQKTMLPTLLPVAAALVAFALSAVVEMSGGHNEIHCLYQAGSLFLMVVITPAAGLTVFNSVIPEVYYGSDGEAPFEEESVGSALEILAAFGLGLSGLVLILECIFWRKRVYSHRLSKEGLPSNRQALMIRYINCVATGLAVVTCVAAAFIAQDEATTGQCSFFTTEYPCEMLWGYGWEEATRGNQSALVPPGIKSANVTDEKEQSTKWLRWRIALHAVVLVFSLLSIFISKAIESAKAQAEWVELLLYIAQLGAEVLPIVVELNSEEGVFNAEIMLWAGTIATGLAVMSLGLLHISDSCNERMKIAKI
uniref:Uncharacterized protein n=1 Tax=Chromera velia CCMP2878 TaxID=1169474 RepID=A0A0G4G2S4_9ALVE|eukprot:Cvel_19903.t1-p1 / transcript=Cvel_19903.t1 / gene=Cvel_19903 / organism=Chromera_velia_CCMP2878 / gene_product=hypothetical protein / transcript_product=hypothetical protein / location=Cvel_scaffold1748:28277-30405(+) / protein_length=422 / sequence_SO=supercontig / SO=protein_coding / is_pseudo=false